MLMTSNCAPLPHHEGHLKDIKALSQLQVRYCLQYTTVSPVCKSQGACRIAEFLVKTGCIAGTNNDITQQESMDYCTYETTCSSATHCKNTELHGSNLFSTLVRLMIGNETRHILLAQQQGNHVMLMSQLNMMSTNTQTTISLVSLYGSKTKRIQCTIDQSINCLSPLNNV